MWFPSLLKVREYADVVGNVSHCTITAGFFFFTDVHILAVPVHELASAEPGEHLLQAVLRPLLRSLYQFRPFALKATVKRGLGKEVGQDSSE